MNFETVSIYAVIGQLFVFVFGSIGVAVTYYAARIGLDVVQHHYKTSKQTDAELESAVKDWAKDLNNSMPSVDEGFQKGRQDRDRPWRS